MDPIGQVISLQDYNWHVREPLASGGFGSVYLASAAGQPPAVLKLVGKDPGAERELLFENLDGVPNVVPILDRGEWDEFWVLAMPRAQKSLRDLLDEDRAPRLEQSLEVLRDVVDALVGIQGRVVHRDIKPENILLLGGRWCLADFGISRYAEATTAPDTRKFSLTPSYAAPEQWRGERATSATDVYATGVVAYEMLAGRRPFTGQDLRLQHLEENPEPILSIPVNLHSLVQECLYKSPETRPQPGNLAQRLKTGVQVTSPSGQRLREAHQVAVERRAEEERQESIARSQEERAARLHETSLQSLRGISQLLFDRVVEEAPSARLTGEPPSMACSLNRAELRISFGQERVVSPMTIPVARPHRVGVEPPFEIVSFARITVAIPGDQSGYRGRSHSLWFCDAQEEGVFRWYETAFSRWLIPTETAFVPCHLNPGDDAFRAMEHMSDYQIARPFTPVDQGQEGEFVERWMGWFADGAQGELRQPPYLPEGQPQGSWRTREQGW